jgi:hypothetical protein
MGIDMTADYTVVIPTMWKYTPFIGFLEDLVECPRVNEVILFDNALNRRPVSGVFHTDKLKVYEYGYNLGVNRPWNLGVEWAKNKKILILNDDVIFDFRVFSRVDKFLTSRSGVIGICPGVQDFKQPKFESGSIKILPWTGQHTYGFGCMMFVHKDWYTPIPDGLAIYYGDNWIFDTCLIQGRTNYIITDALFHTPFATSTKELTNINELHQKEQPIYNNAIATFRSTHQLKNL